VTKPGAKASSIPLLGKDCEPTIFEISKPGHSTADLGTPAFSGSASDYIKSDYLRSQSCQLVEISERDVVAHFTRLSHRQYSVDLGMYPLGSCTMKYNPKFCDEVANMEGLTECHPMQPAKLCQGWLNLLFNLEAVLCEITGMKQACLQPAAGAAGELTGLLIMRAYHNHLGRVRSKVIIPDSAHGTNPASVTLGGYQTITVGTNEYGLVNTDHLESLIDEDVAGIMLTNPNTLGLFEQDIEKIAKLIHEAGGLLYYDGANLNPILGVVRPGDMGFDIVHLNLHKTFATPHGGGGPGAGPIGVSERLVDFLPGPKVIQKQDGSFDYFYPSKSIGRIHSFHGNALVLARALAYIIYHGRDGLKRVGQIATLNANWIKEKLKSSFTPRFEGRAMHEVVLSASRLKKETGVKAIDVAKALLDRGYHAPTIYFPLIVEEALMIEPTETESLDTLSDFVDTMLAIKDAAYLNPGSITGAPFNTPVGRVDEALAARRLIATFDAINSS
jgi:glycine dehydrogenase subunit 2